MVAGSVGTRASDADDAVCCAADSAARLGGGGSGSVITLGRPTSVGSSVAAGSRKSATSLVTRQRLTSHRWWMMRAARFARSAFSPFAVHLILNACPTPSAAPAVERGCGASGSVAAPK